VDHPKTYPLRFTMLVELTTGSPPARQCDVAVRVSRRQLHACETRSARNAPKVARSKPTRKTAPFGCVAPQGINALPAIAAAEER
jgi:hypothetical protein